MCPQHCQRLHSAVCGAVANVFKDLSAHFVCITAYSTPTASRLLKQSIIPLAAFEYWSVTFSPVNHPIRLHPMELNMGRKNPITLMGRTPLLTSSKYRSQVSTGLTWEVSLISVAGILLLLAGFMHADPLEIWSAFSLPINLSFPASQSPYNPHCQLLIINRNAVVSLLPTLLWPTLTITGIIFRWKETNYQ